MSANEKILNELHKINKKLTMLSIPIGEESWDLFKHKYLKSAPRKNMYNLFEGKLQLSQIAKKLGVSLEAVRVFAKELQNKGYLDFVEEGNKRYPRRLVDERWSIETINWKNGCVNKA